MGRSARLWDRMLVGALPLAPQAVVKRVARRYVAGETLEQAIQTVQELNAEGALATVDVLGESVRDHRAARTTVQSYLRLLEGIANAGVESNVSVKLTALGLKLDEDICRLNLARIARRARELDNFVRIDMEDHSCTDATLRIYRQIQPEVGNLGVVLQAMLRRTPADIASLTSLTSLTALNAHGRMLNARGGERDARGGELNARGGGLNARGGELNARGGGLNARGGGLNVRLCKGIYREPAELAFQEADEVRQAYVAGLDQLLVNGAYVGVATHDEALVEAALDRVGRLGLPRDAYELQMLLGVRPGLRRRLIADGHRLRVYVPYGADWYTYSMRRLRENPAIARHVTRAMLRKG